MQESPRPPISATASIKDGLSALAKPPFRGLLALALFVSLVSNSVPAEADQAALLVTFVLIAASLYLQIAVTLAAAEAEPRSSTDTWLKLAFARRCFWRYVATSVLVVVLVLAAGVVGLVVGAFLVGGILALADPAVVLERRGPMGAMSRSAELSKPARQPLIVIFGALVLVPGVLVQVGEIAWDLRERTGSLWPVLPIIVLVLGFAGAIALARAFVVLGGRTSPPEELRVRTREKP